MFAKSISLFCYSLIALELSGCGSQAEYFNAPIGTFVAGPNSYKGKLLPPVDLPFAGIYSIPRTVTLLNSKQTTTEQDYMYISSTGVISTYVDQSAGNFSVTQNCYLPASGNEPNARLQGAQLYETSDQSGNIYYHASVDGNDIGLAQSSSTNGNNALTVYINGTLQTGSGSSIQTYTESNGDVFILGGAPIDTISLSNLNICT